jgi:hypothetical protein
MGKMRNVYIILVITREGKTQVCMEGQYAVEVDFREIGPEGMKRM